MNIYTVHMCFRIPIGANGGVVGELVVVNAALTLGDEPLLHAVGTDTGHAHYRLLEMGIDWRSCGRLKSLQLT